MDLVSNNPYFRISFFLTFRIDADAFLTDATLAWLQATMQELGHPQQAVANEFIPETRMYLIPPFYRQLRIKTRDHLRSKQAPELAVAPKAPDTEELGWNVHADVLAEVNNEVDTFGLIEGGDWAAGAETTEVCGDIE